MSLLNSIAEGSLLSNERLLQAREFYSPDAEAAAGRPTLAGWTKRVTMQSELASARELAGLSDAELMSLEDEFTRCQIRPRSAWQRRAVPLGLALLAIAGCGLAAPLLDRLSEADARLLQIVSAAVFLIGLISLGAGFVRAFASVPLDLSHGTVGLYVGQLDERHPWLYKTLRVARHEAADEYRRRVLTERGLLRGTDYVVMREIVRVHETLDQARPARSVVEQLQLLPAPPADGGGSEPRLVQIKSGTRG